MLTNREYVGGVPVVIRLSDSDVLHATEKPAPVAFLLPRTTLLVAILKDVLQLFAPYTAALSRYTTQVWFSYQGTPVSWVYPVGAVKDYVRELCQLRLAELQAAATTTASLDMSADDPNDDVQTLYRHALLSQPIELDFRVHQAGTGGVVEHRVPTLVNFEQLDQYVWHEVRQVHKASYTALYGSSKCYFNEPEATLRPAIAMALYRPFGTAATPPRTQRGGETGNGDGQAASDKVGSGGDSLPRTTSSTGPATADETNSPYLLSEYQHLLQSVLHRRHVAYVLQIAFPWAYRHASPDEPGRLRFHLARVPATPPLRSPAPPPALPNETTTTAAEAHMTADVAEAAREVYAAVETGDGGGGGCGARTGSSSPPAAQLDEREEAITLGLLLWRFFRVPCLRWRQRQRGADTIFPASARADAPTLPSHTSDKHETGSASTTAEAPRPTSGGGTEIQQAYDALLAALAPFYTDIPPELGDIAQILSEPDELRSVARGVSAPWAAWESTCVERLIAAYEPHASGRRRRRGIGFAGPPVPGATSATPRRVFFALQGTRPSLRCPALFLETHLASSDRALFITIEVNEETSA